MKAGWDVALLARSDAAEEYKVLVLCSFSLPLAREDDCSMTTRITHAVASGTNCGKD